MGLALVLGSAALVVLFTPGRQPTPGLLSIEFVLSFFVLSGMRLAFGLPAELRANWAFQAAEPCPKEPCAAGVRKAMLLLGVFPVLAALAPVHACLWGLWLASAHFLYGAVLSALLVEVLLMRFDKIPFTCSYLPGKANMKAFWPLYSLAFWAYGYGLAKMEYALLANPAGLALVCAAAVSATVALRRRRKRKLASGVPFLFEDLPEPVVQTLNIGW